MRRSGWVPGLGLAVALFVLMPLAVSCGVQSANRGSAGRESPRGEGARTATHGPLRTWRIGGVTVSTRVLPATYDANVSSWPVGPSAIYYVKRSSPTKLMARSLSTGKTDVTATIPCTLWSGLGPGVTMVPYPYLLVECGVPPSGSLSQGILVDVRSGRTWTLWTGGGMTEDGTYDGEAIVAGGWVYFDWIDPGGGPSGAMDLTTGVTKPLPSLLARGFGPSVVAGGVLYVGLGPKSIDLYRVIGFTSTLVAHLPVFPWGIDARGVIWEPKPGGSLTPGAGAMSIRVWNPGVPAKEVLATGPGYVVLGVATPYEADGLIRVTVATAGASGTVTIGKGNVGNTIEVPGGLLFRNSNGRWELLTVSDGR